MEKIVTRVSLLLALTIIQPAAFAQDEAASTLDTETTEVADVDYWQMSDQELEALADSGDAAAALSFAQRLAWSEEDGDAERARSYAKAAMDAGLIGGKSVYADYLAQGVGGPVDGPEAVRLYEELIEVGAQDVRSSLADILDGSVEGVEKDLERAFSLYFADVQSGSAYGAVSLANWYENGTYFSKDLMAAADWYEKSADLGWDWNYYTAAYMLQENIDGGAMFRRAVALMTKAVEVDESAHAMNNLGVLYMDGYKLFSSSTTSLGDDPRKAFSVFMDCYEMHEDAYCAYNLAVLYEAGRGTSMNRAKAREMYQVALDSGDPALADAADALRNL